MASKVGEAFVELTAENAKLRTRLKQSEAVTQQVADRMQKTFDRLGRRMLTALTAALGTIFVRRTLQTTMQIESLRNAFVNLAGGVESANRLMSAMQEGFQGTASQAEILQQANNALLLQLPVNEENMRLMAEAARRLGKAMGLTTARAMESLTVGIGRQSRLWLDNLGIIVRTESAYESMAEKLGKTTSELTDAEKRLAFFEAAMDGVRERLGKLGPDIEDNTDKWNRLRSTFMDLLEVMGRGALDPVGEGMQRINDSLKEMEPLFENVGKAAGFVISELGTLSTDFARFIDEASLALRGLIDSEGEAAIRAKRTQQDQERAAKERLDAELRSIKDKRAAEKQAEREFEEWQIKKRREEEKTAKLVTDLQNEILELSGFSGMKELQEFRERMNKIREEYKNNEKILTLVKQIETARRVKIEEENLEKEAQRASEIRQRRIQREKNALEEELQANEKLQRSLVQLEQEFLRRIEKEEDADLIRRKRYYMELRELAKDNQEALRIINAAEIAEQKRVEDEKRAEIQKTREARRPQFVGAEEVFRRATIAGASISPTKMQPTEEEKQIAKNTRKTVEKLDEVVRGLESRVAVLGE